MMKPKKLLDIYKHPRTDGIFQHMMSNGQLTYIIQSISNGNPSAIDMDYFYNHSGLKRPSLLLEHLFCGYITDDDSNYVIDYRGNKITSEYMLLELDQEIIDSIILSKFLNKWNKLIETLSYNYNALNPYTMNVRESRENNGEHSFEQTNQNSGTVDSSTFGFNSTNPAPTDRDSTVTSGSTKSIGTSKDGGTRNITRSGNIGNKSAMQLIEEEREMLRFQILDVIYQDLDSILTRSKYF